LMENGKDLSISFDKDSITKLKFINRWEYIVRSNRYRLKRANLLLFVTVFGGFNNFIQQKPSNF
ncbi:hypothetical protein ACU55E_000951, partial [Listeria monocytogenes]